MDFENHHQHGAARLKFQLGLAHRRATRWGDVTADYNPPSTSTQPDTGDISALVNKFKSAVGAPIKARALLSGTDAFGSIGHSTLNVDTSFGHVAACVDAFKGQAYPYMIQSCP